MVTCSVSALLAAVCLCGGTVINVTDSDGKPIANAAVELSKSNDFDAPNLINVKDKTNSDGRVVASELTEEKLAGAKHLYARVTYVNDCGTRMRGSATEIECDGTPPDKIDLRVEANGWTCVPCQSTCECDRWWQRRPLLRLMLRMPIAAGSVFAGGMIREGDRIASEPTRPSDQQPSALLGNRGEPNVAAARPSRLRRR
jgi:hypothetical protein